MTSLDINHASTDITLIRQPVIGDIAAVDNMICRELASDVPLIQQITRHIIESGGKRLRPLVVLLAAKACGYEHDIEHQELATVIEFIHTATLLHDDVVDNSERRRGLQTANAIWGNEASVLVGDFLYSRAFQILAKRSHVPITKLLANTTNQIAEGELWQLMNQHDPDINENIYREIIRRKTAELFAAASSIGAFLGVDTNWTTPAQTFGLHLGMAYQMIDDYLDYTANPEGMGKNVGDDLAEGKVTLPLIYAKQQGNAAQIALIRHAIEKGGLQDLKQILKILEETNAFSYTLQCAKEEIVKAKQALYKLPVSPYRKALTLLADFVVERRY